MSFTRRQVLRDGGLLSMLGSSRLWQLTATGAGILLPSSYVLAEVKVYRDLAITSPFGKLGVLTAAQIRDGAPLIEKFFLVEASDHKHAVNLTDAEMNIIRSGSLAKFKSAEHFAHRHDITIDPSKPIPGGSVLYDEAPTNPVVTTPPANSNPPVNINQPVTTPTLPPSPPLISTPNTLPPANTGLPPSQPLIMTPNNTVPPTTNNATPTSGLKLDFNIRLGYGETPFIYLMSNKPLAQDGAKFRGQSGQWNKMYQVDVANKYVFSSYSRIDFKSAASNEDVLIEFSAQSLDGETKTYAFLLRKR